MAKGTYIAKKKHAYKRKGIYRKKRVVAMAVHRNFAIQRNVFPTLPSIMRVSLRAHRQAIDDTPILGAVDGYYIPLWLPGIFANMAGTPTWAGGLLQLAQIYCKFVVKGARINFKVQSLGQGAGNTNVDFITVVLSTTEATQLDGISSLSQYEQFNTMPSMRRKMLSTAQGGAPFISDYRAVDVLKFANMPLTQASSFLRTYSAGVNITGPSTAEAASLPCFGVGSFWTSGTGIVQIRSELTIDYDVEFSEIGELWPVITSQPTLSFSQRT